MIEEYAKSSDYLYDNADNVPSKSRRRKIVKMLSTKLRGHVLDIGCRSPMADDFSRERPNIHIHNTDHDLDEPMEYNSKFNTVLCLDVLEHLFNPLVCLNFIKSVMAKDATLYVSLPLRPCFLSFKGHFHEITDRQFRLLCKRAGMVVVRRERYKVWRHPLSYLTGLRMLLRLPLEFGVLYTICKED